MIPGDAPSAGFGLLMFLLGGTAGVVLASVPLWLRVVTLRRRMVKLQAASQSSMGSPEDRSTKTHCAELRSAPQGEKA